jgi:hypothetical protein
VYGAHPVHGSHAMFKHVGYLLLSLGAVIWVTLRGRKK